MDWLRASSALLLLGPLAGCVLLVPDYDPVPNCPIAGNSACATCLRTNCQAEINGCCGEKECREDHYSLTSDDELGTMIAALDTCGGGDSRRCADAVQAAQASPAGDVVKGCLTTKCKNECAAGTAVTKWTCDAPHGADACSSCIFSKCSSGLTSCCADPQPYTGCPTQIQDEMTACTGGDAAGCAAIRTKDDSGEQGVVRECIIDSCSDVCFGDGRQHQTCTLREGGSYCDCTNAPQSSGDACSRATVPKSHCFYSASGCICGHYACTLDDSIRDYPACQCGLRNAKDGTGEAATCNPQSLGYGGTEHDHLATCCLTPGGDYAGVFCECKTLTSGTCPEGSEEVFSCDRTSFFDALASVATDTCSN